MDKILARMKESPIVLLSGPSGSGKTTTAMKVERELERRGSTPTRCPWTTTSRPSTAGPPPHAGGGHRLRVPETAGHGAAGRDL
ncbi:adenylyl-sulfate kinase [Flavonifractor plautii]|nr:adenylyl-sulfate kinase [Flavonifractor plautii]